jgi:hypothetical protein
MTQALDGNAAAGVLAELFLAEMTTATTVCVACGDQRPVGELRTYLSAPGVVLRCTGCDAVQLRVVTDGRRAWLDLRGIRTLCVELPPTDRGRDSGPTP